MNRFFIRKGVYEYIEKAFRDRSHLVPKEIVDKNGVRRKVLVKPNEEEKKVRTKKVEESTEKRISKPEEHKKGDSVKINGKEGTFKITSKDNDGAYHVVSADGKKGYKVAENLISAAKEKADFKEMYSEAHEQKRDFKEENLISDLSKKVKFTNAQKKAIDEVFSKGDYKSGDAAKLLNDLATENKEIYNQLQKQNSELWNESGKSTKTFSSMDLIKTKLDGLLKNKELKKTNNGNEYSAMNDKEFFDKYKDIIPSMGRYGTPETQKQNIKSEIEFQEYMKNNGSDGYSKLKHEVLKEALNRLSNEKKDSNKQLTPTYGRKQIPTSKFVAADYKQTYDDDKIDTTSAGIEEALRQAQEMPIMKRHPEFLIKLRSDLDKADNAKETVSEYRISGSGAEAVYTPERQKIHNKIIDKLIAEKIDAAKPKDGEQPTFQILGGRGGSGKSTFNKKKSDAGVYHEDNVIIVDPDALKQELANESKDGWEGWKARQYHEESSDVSKMLMKKAMALGLNIVMDITMSNADKQIDELKLAKSLGYKTGAYYMHVPKQESFKRAMKRYIESETQSGVEDYSGRLVPPDVLLSMTGNEANFDKIKDFADDWSFYDNFIPFEKDPNTNKNKYKAEKIAQKGE